MSAQAPARLASAHIAPHVAPETRAAHDREEPTMQPDHDTITQPTPDDPQTHDRDAVEAMQAMCEAKSDVERALTAGAGRHARFLERHGLSDHGAE